MLFENLVEAGSRLPGTLKPADELSFIKSLRILQDRFDMAKHDLSAIFILVVMIFVLDLIIQLANDLLFFRGKMQGFVGIVVEEIELLDFLMQQVAYQKVFVKIDHKAIFFHLDIADLYHLSRAGKRQRTIIMVVFGPAIFIDSCFHFFKADHVEIACELTGGDRTGRSFITPDQADQRVSWTRIIIETMEFGDGAKMFHLAVGL